MASAPTSDPTCLRCKQPRSACTCGVCSPATATLQCHLCRVSGHDWQRCPTIAQLPTRGLYWMHFKFQGQVYAGLVRAVTEGGQGARELREAQCQLEAVEPFRFMSAGFVWSRHPCSEGPACKAAR